MRVHHSDHSLGYIIWIITRAYCLAITRGVFSLSQGCFDYFFHKGWSALLYFKGRILPTKSSRAHYSYLYHWGHIVWSFCGLQHSSLALGEYHWASLLIIGAYASLSRPLLLIWDQRRAWGYAWEKCSWSYDYLLNQMLCMACISPLWYHTTQIHLFGMSMHCFLSSLHCRYECFLYSGMQLYCYSFKPTIG